jgi:beta-lactamase regulating signal transducer with metallopeptidase domain
VEFLANWLVQGAIVVIIAAVLLRVLHRARANARYWVCIAGFLSVLVLPMMTPLAAFLWQQDAGVMAPASTALVSLPHDQPSRTVISIAWLVWFGVYAARLAITTVRVKGTRRRFREFPRVVEDRLCYWTGVRQRGRKTRLAVSDDVRAAAVIGGGSPVIAVAPALIGQLSADELDRVVIHEWAHVQRRDDAANLLQLIARLLVGWHPALWWFDRRLQAEREAACDEAAVRITASSKRYAACLLKIASLPLAPCRVRPALGVLSSATLSARIHRIVAHKHQGSPTWSRTAACAGIVVLFGACCGISSFRVVGAAMVSPEPNVIQVTATPIPALESPRSIVSSVASTPSPQAARRERRRSAAAPSPSVRTVIAAPAEPLTNHVAADAAPDVTEVETIDPSESPPDPPLPAASAEAPVAPATTPWAAAAIAGITVGERSKKGGLATAAFFTRVGKRIADSF